ncbi:cell growth-regulating nucleolar protein isoform X2 [Trichomycterus rosablanca]|uniref:cell growth-regulating nucleolar protein isoform X2 n=1 Tax=Trichomycterus rosablanca TaxID=2290929 RepID=UPI002F354241
MVFFTCNGCGESLKRAQIQKHVGMCRGARVFSCIDCGTDFQGDDYKSHMKCISEDQKYGGKNYEAKANKGDVKQQQWIQSIQEMLSKPGVNGRLRSVLQQVASYDNVPRKKAKFQNWMKNSLRIYDANLQDQVWDIFSSTDTNVHVQQTNRVETANNPQQTEAPAEQNELQKPEQVKKNKRERKEERQQKKKKKRTENGGVENQQDGENGVEERQRKKKKRNREEEECEEEENVEETTTRIKKKKKNQEKSEESQNTEDDEQEVNEESSSKEKFNWKGTIKAVLRQAPEEGISVKKLRKKVLSAYCAYSGERNYKSEEELYTLFNKKLKNPKFRMVKDKVKLIK